MELYLHSSIRLHGVVFKYREIFTFTFYFVLYHRATLCPIKGTTFLIWFHMDVPVSCSLFVTLNVELEGVKTARM